MENFRFTFPAFKKLFYLYHLYLITSTISVGVIGALVNLVVTRAIESFSLTLIILALTQTIFFTIYFISGDDLLSACDDFEVKGHPLI